MRYRNFRACHSTVRSLSMEQVDSATLRLRQTFKYPTEDNDSDRDELDEEEQDALVDNLRAKDAKENERYSLIFSIVPLTVILPFLFYLPSSSPRTALFCILAITSLLSTSFIMRYMPLGALSRSRARPLDLEPGGPVERYLPYLNGGIAGLLMLASLAVKGRPEEQDGLWLFMLMPTIVFVMVIVARKSMEDVETGITELNNMKYDYKGA